MPLPRGVDPEKAITGYAEALLGLTYPAIVAGIRKFLRGECEGVSTKFCPHPPELASIIRSAVYAAAPKPTGKLYRYKPPKSAILKRGIMKGDAWDAIENGVYPRGSIWCPGPIGDKPEVGDLYGPDPTWQRAVPLKAA
jgi:hypothetical protein